MSKENKPEKKKKLREMDIEYLVLYRIALGILPFIIIAVIFFWIFGNKITNGMTECYFKKITGLYCIGCGGTRAFNHFVRFHWLKSLYYHPFVPYAFFSYFLFIINGFLYRHNFKCIEKINPLVLIYVGVGVLFLSFAIKNILLIFFGIHLID